MEAIVFLYLVLRVCVCVAWVGDLKKFSAFTSDFPSSGAQRCVCTMTQCVNKTRPFWTRKKRLVVFFGQLRTSAVIWNKIVTTIRQLDADVVSSMWLPDDPLACSCFDHIFSPRASVWLPALSTEDLVRRWGIRRRPDRDAATSVFMYHSLYHAMRLLERKRECQLETVFVMRTDVTYSHLPATLPHIKEERVLVLGGVSRFMWRHEFNDTSTLCSPNPFDIMFYGTPSVIELVGSTIMHMNEIMDAMRLSPERRTVRESHNRRVQNTFLENNEAFLGFRMRMSGLRCRVVSSGAKIHKSAQSRWNYHNMNAFNGSDPLCSH